MKKPLLIATVALTSLVPLTLFAQTDQGFARNGVFGCNQTGAYAMSVGALSAVGGVYVPVNDAAVTLNTGYLVYKECVLRGIVDRIRENATASIDQSITRVYTQGRALPLGGNGAYFSQSIPLEAQTIYDKAIIDSSKNGYFNNLNPAFKEPVVRAIYTGYMATRNNPNAVFACDYQGDLSSALNGNPQGSYWDSVGALMNPACNPYYAYYAANNSILSTAATNWNNIQTQLNWYNGNYPVIKYDSNGNPIVQTPGSVVGSNYLQAEQTGFNQLQNANDIDQIIGALFAGLTTQVVADQGGLVGLTQGKPSYLDRVVQDSLSGLRASIANLGLQILLPAQTNEQNYLKAFQAIAQKLTDTMATLRQSELRCWNLVTSGSIDGSSGSQPHVCYTALTWTGSQATCKAPPVCTDNPDYVPNDPNNPRQLCVDGPTLHVATSTQFSQAVIDAKISPLTSSTNTTIEAEQTVLGLIQGLIDNVQNTNAVDAERQAISDLDKITASGHPLHNQYDAINAGTTRDSVIQQMNNLVCTDTNCDVSLSAVKQWADSTDTKTGWCNVQNKAVIDAWQNCWTPTSTSTCLWRQ